VGQASIPQCTQASAVNQVRAGVAPITPGRTASLVLGTPENACSCETRDEYAKCH
jgi:hypothetical protein